MSANDQYELQRRTMDVTTCTRHPITSHEYTMLLLAGSLVPSPLRRSIDVPVLCLPIDAHHTLLDLWINMALTVPICREMTISLRSHADAEHVKRCIQESRTLQLLHSSTRAPYIHTIVDSEDCRGSGGVFIDALRSRQQGDCRPIIVAEASALPLYSHASALLSSLGHSVSGMIASTKSSVPAGLYAFSSHVVEALPQAAFLDLKEQLLPILHERGIKIRSVVTSDRAIRLWTRSQYLNAVQYARDASGNQSVLCSSTARVAKSARLSGVCVVCDDVVIDDNAVIHNSILMGGSHVRADAVVAHTVVGPCAEVTNTITDSVVTKSKLPTDSQLLYQFSRLLFRRRTALRELQYSPNGVPSHG